MVAGTTMPLACSSKRLATSLVSDSMVTREYSGAGHTRTAKMVAPRAICCVPSSSTRLPACSRWRRLGV
eukprot:gene45888-57200_t